MAATLLCALSAGIMDSSSGKPTVTPAIPFKNVRRCKCFLVMIMGSGLLFYFISEALRRGLDCRIHMLTPLSVWFLCFIRIWKGGLLTIPITMEENL